jgi:hypothetical protein
MDEYVHPKSRRILFVADRACGNQSLCAEVRAHAIPGADVLVVAPVANDPSHRWITDDADDRARAEVRLQNSISCLRKQGLHAHGTFGDADPVQAVDDALYGFSAEEIVICLEARERTHWRRRGTVERIKERFPLPVSEIVVGSRRPAIAR